MAIVHGYPRFMSGAPPVRASDDNREHTVRVLRDAVVQGRLSHETFVWRVDQALRARDSRSLEQLLADLAPAMPSDHAPPRLRATGLRRWLADLGRRQKPLTPGVTGRPVLVVGRRSTCDVVLSDRRVSRVHAVLMLVGDQWLIEDLRSTNGTTLNGTRLRSAAPLHPGDLLGFGGVTRRYNAPPCATGFAVGPSPAH
jgi:FHA domain/Domain of unknown function (DUF1707)